MKFFVYLMWSTISAGASVEARVERSYDNMSDCLYAAREMNRAESVYIKTRGLGLARKWFCLTAKESTSMSEDASDA